MPLNLSNRDQNSGHLFYNRRLRAAITRFSVRMKHEFLTVNPGLAGRFNRKLRFESYSPDELVEIAVRYGDPRATVIEPAARDALSAACRKLRAYLAPDGTHGIDLMQNGRFARNVVERAERLRDSRVAAQNRTNRGSVTVEDLETLRTQDVVAAVMHACTEKHVPIEL